MKMFTLDLSKKNAAVSIIFTLDMVFFVVWLLLGIRSLHLDMMDKVWGAFLGANGALFLLLNAEAKKDAGVADDSANPSMPVNPAKPETKQGS